MVVAERNLLVMSHQLEISTSVHELSHNGECVETQNHRILSREYPVLVLAVTSDVSSSDRLTATHGGHNVGSNAVGIFSLVASYSKTL